MAIAPVAVAFAALFVFLCAATLSKGWSSSLGALLEYVAQKADSYKISLRGLPDIHFDFLARWLRAVDHEIRALLGRVVYFTAQPWIVLCRYMATVFERPVRELGDVVADVAHTIGRIRSVVVPAMIAAALGPTAALAERIARQVASLIERPAVHIVHETTKIVTKTVEAVVSKAVAIPFPRLGRVEREAAGLAERVTGLARAVAGTGAAVMVGVALGRLGLGWARCSRVRRVGKAVCGMDSSLLGTILADSAAIFGMVSLVQFASVLVTVQEGVAKLVMDGFRETRGIEPHEFTGYTGTLG